MKANISFIEQIEDELLESNIKIRRVSYGVLKALALKDYQTIVLDTHLIQNKQEERTILLHEQQHFEFDIFYTTATPLSRRLECEYEVNSRLIKKVLPYELLFDMLRRYATVYEISEELCLTETFIKQAFNYYKDCGLIFDEEGGC